MAACEKEDNQEPSRILCLLLARFHAPQPRLVWLQPSGGDAVDSDP